MYIHELNPIAFSLFDFKIYWYSLSYLFGFIFSYFYVKFILNKDFVNISFEIFEDFLVCAVIVVIIVGIKMFLIGKSVNLKSYLLVVLVIILQVALGILTLISGLNLYLASLHQITSIILVLSVLNLNHKMS